MKLNRHIDFINEYNKSDNKKILDVIFKGLSGYEISYLGYTNFLGFEAISVDFGEEPIEICLNYDGDEVIYYKDDGDNAIIIDEFKIENDNSLENIIKIIKNRLNLIRSKTGVDKYQL